MPVAIVSSSSRPGVRRWTCGSTKRRREHEPGAVDDAVAVGVEALADRRDRAAVDADVEDRVDAFGRVEDAGAADDEVVGSAPADEDGALTSGHPHGRLDRRPGRW